MLVRDKAREDAEAVLRAYGDLRFPIDPERIAKRMGMYVDRRPLGKDISGMLRVEPDFAPQIYIDEADTSQRQRFTIAHEIGHYYERTLNGEGDFNFIDRRGGRYDVHEFYADEFAGNLLMPEAEVRRMDETSVSIAELAARFGVSLPAIRMRLKRLGPTA